MSGTITFLEEGKAQATHTFETYLPSADVNGDGFPEGNPVNTFTVSTLDTRVPSPSPVLPSSPVRVAICVSRFPMARW